MQQVADDVSWEFEGPELLRFSGIRRGKQGAFGFFAGIADEHGNPDLRMEHFRDGKVIRLKSHRQRRLCRREDA